MKKHSLFFLTSFAGLLVLLSACQKHLDFAKDREIGNTPLPGQTSYCRIESIWENPNAFNQRFILVLYDEFENPVAITTPVVGTSHPYCTFKYDSWHRLREFRGEYVGGAFEFLHLYGFDNYGRIGVDTAYSFGQLSIEPFRYLDRSISTIEYDNQNRVVRTILENERSDIKLEVNYTYDAAGNLMYPPDAGIIYDNKVNLHWTNDI